MSNIYDEQLRRAIPKVDDNIRPVRLGYVIGPIFNSPTNAKASSVLGAEVNRA